MTHLSFPSLTVNSSRRSLTMMLMLCWRKACPSLKRCVLQRTNTAVTAIISQMARKGFNLWWPKLRLSWRVSDGSVSSGIGVLSRAEYILQNSISYVWVTWVYWKWNYTFFLCCMLALLLKIRIQVLSKAHCFRQVAQINTIFKGIINERVTFWTWKV